MSGLDGQTTEADVAMSEDSGIGASASSTTGETLSDVLSTSGSSVNTLVGPEKVQSEPAGLQQDSGYSSRTAQGSGKSDNLGHVNLPWEMQNSEERTQKWVEENFEVFVKNLDGKTHTIQVEQYEDVSSFRQKIGKKLGVPADQQRLTSQEGKTLEDGKSLCEYNIKKHSTVYCQGRLRGGVFV